MWAEIATGPTLTPQPASGNLLCTFTIPSPLRSFDQRWHAALQYPDGGHSSGRLRLSMVRRWHPHGSATGPHRKAPRAAAGAGEAKRGAGRFQARQEHTAIALEGFVYVINGFVPIMPEPVGTEADPEPFRFTPTNEMLAYVPEGHEAAEECAAGEWRVLDEASWFPHDTYHHMMAAIRDREIWAIGGHSGDFDPVDTLYIYRPNGADDPDGSWRQIDSQGEECETDCLRLPGERAAGAAVTLDDKVIVLGGVIPNEGTDDPNGTIRATNSVIYLDTTETPYEWRDAPPMIEAREHLNAAVADGRVWAFHGRRADNTRMRGVESWAPGEPSWRREPSAPIGTSANILAAIGDCVYSFGGEFNANNVTGTVIASQVFHVPSRSWRLLNAAFAEEPFGADPGVMSKHGTYGLVYEEDGQQKIMAPGGAFLAWFAPMSPVHVFTPTESASRLNQSGSEPVVWRGPADQSS